MSLDKARQIINEIDREIVRLFEERMDVVRQVADYKDSHGLPVEDRTRETELMAQNVSLLSNSDYRPYYTRFLQSTMNISKDYQRDRIENDLFIKTKSGGYPVHIGSGLLCCIGELLPLNRKVLIVTDSGVPEQYAMTVASQCSEAFVFSFEQGEKSKCLKTYEAILATLTENGFTRTDCIVAVGGGVVGDLAGFAAATYLRGVDFYMVPTTLLAQVDASVGGKTAIDFLGYKNIVGSFSASKGVVIDVDTLDTLPPRQIANGMAEVIKMAMTCDADLFALLEETDEPSEAIIRRAIKIKKSIVEADEMECHLRKVLNFGHTLGHAYESATKNLFHGECVAMGMLPMCHPDIVRRVERLLHKWGLATEYVGDNESVLEFCRHDKKRKGEAITLVTVPRIGEFEIKDISFTDFEKWYRGRNYYEKYIWE